MACSTLVLAGITKFAAESAQWFMELVMFATATELPAKAWPFHVGHCLLHRVKATKPRPHQVVSW